MLSHFFKSTVIQWITFVCTCFQKDYIVCLLFHDDTVWSYLQANRVLPLINCSDVGCHQPKRIQMLGEQMTQYYLFILIFHHMIHYTYIMIPFRSWVLECAFLVFCKDVWWFSLQDKPSPAPTKEQLQRGGFLLGRASCRRRRRTICKRRLFRQRYVRDQEKEVSHIESNCTKMTGSTLTMLVGELSRSGESAMKGWSPLDLPNYRYVSQLEFPRL